MTALKAKKLKPIPLSGQDATAQGVQNIISGWQSMTVWKDTRKLATRIGRGGDRPGRRARSRSRPGRCRTARKKLPAFIIPPVSITKANYKQLFNGYLKRSEVCRGEYRQFCK